VFTYDGKGRQVSRTDPRGCVTRWRYGLSGERISKTDPDEFTTPTIRIICPA
jgi:YD repeat-containing protein